MTDLLHSRYRLDQVLGQGAMGVVWRAHDEVLDRPIAVKELRPAPGVDPDEALQRFLVEARAAARLSHPNIVGVHDVFSDDQRVLIVMELVEGPTLDQVVAATGAQSPETVRAVMAQVAQALASAHGAGVIHRDLKPENIFWTNGRAVVADFGLARIGVGRGTVEGTVMGTPGYMAPEQVRGTATGPAADVFGWGAVAYHLAAGRDPFGEQSQTDPSAMAYRIVHEDPPPLHLPDDPALAALITQAMSKDPTHRPADGMALAGRLAEAVHHQLSAPPHPQSSRELTRASDGAVVPTPSMAVWFAGTDESEPAAPVGTTRDYRPITPMMARAVQPSMARRPGGRRRAVMASQLFVITSLAFLVAGLFNAGLGPMYVSLGCSIAASLFVLAASRMTPSLLPNDQ